MSIKEDENFAKALEAFYRKRGYSNLERVRAALEAYFPRAIAEAVAAERERCAKVCEAHSNGALCSAMIGGPDARGLQNISRAHQRAAQSIRSAAK